MGFLRSFFSQCARPEGFLGRVMLRFMALQAKGDADDGDHQYQSCDEILQGYMQTSEYDPDDVS